MGVVLLIVAVVALNGVAIATLLRQRARSLPIASIVGGSSNGALGPPRGQLILLEAALRTLAIRALLVLACARRSERGLLRLDGPSRQQPASSGGSRAVLRLLAALRDCGHRQHHHHDGGDPKAERDPLSINAALSRRFARRSSQRVKAILATVLVLAMPLAATGVIAKAPSGLLGGVSLEFYVITVAMLVALLPEPHIGAAKAGTSGRLDIPAAPHSRRTHGSTSEAPIEDRRPVHPG